MSGSCSLALGCFHVFFHSKQMKIELATQQGPKQSRTILQFLTDDSAGFDCLENYGKKYLQRDAYWAGKGPVFRLLALHMRLHVKGD